MGAIPAAGPHSRARRTRLLPQSQHSTETAKKISSYYSIWTPRFDTPCRPLAPVSLSRIQATGMRETFSDCFVLVLGDLQTWFLLCYLYIFEFFSSSAPPCKQRDAELRAAVTVNSAQSWLEPPPRPMYLAPRSCDSLFVISACRTWAIKTCYNLTLFSRD